jgi:hypothetical protein
MYFKQKYVTYSGCHIAGYSLFLKREHATFCLRQTVTVCFWSVNVLRSVWGRLLQPVSEAWTCYVLSEADCCSLFLKRERATFCLRQTVTVCFWNVNMLRSVWGRLLQPVSETWTCYVLSEADCYSLFWNVNVLRSVWDILCAYLTTET